MTSARTLVILLGVAAATRTVMQRLHGSGTGRAVPGGTLINDAVVYDTMSRLLLGSFFGHIADDAAEFAPDNAQVLEVGCGPGHLSIRLARRHGLAVTGLDLDPAMIERARANADSAGDGAGRRPVEIEYAWSSRAGMTVSDDQRYQYLAAGIASPTRSHPPSVSRASSAPTTRRPRRRLMLLRSR